MNNSDCTDWVEVIRGRRWRVQWTSLYHTDGLPMFPLLMYFKVKFAEVNHCSNWYNVGCFFQLNVDFVSTLTCTYVKVRCLRPDSIKQHAHVCGRQVHPAGFWVFSFLSASRRRLKTQETIIVQICFTHFYGQLVGSRAGMMCLWQCHFVQLQKKNSICFRKTGSWLEFITSFSELVIKANRTWHIAGKMQDTGSFCAQRRKGKEREKTWVNINASVKTKSPGLPYLLLPIFAY